MTDYIDSDVVGFGKFSFVRKNHSIPALPDMKLIVFKKGDVYQAICIDIEIDAVGENTLKACGNLKQALNSYISQMVENYNGSTKSAVEDIINTAFSNGELKSILFNRYLQAKRSHLLYKIKKENKAKSRKEELFNGIRKFFQVAPIHFDLTLAAGIA
jgi:hypothetical protein